MNTRNARGWRNGVARTARGLVLAGAMGLLLTRPEIAPGARDALLGVFAVMLAVTALVSDGESPDDDPGQSAEETSWHEYEGSFRGMIG